MKKFFIVINTVLFLSGCTVQPAVVEAPTVEVPTVRVAPPVQVITPAPVVPVQPAPRYYDNDYDDKHHYHQHKHKHKNKDCPPGLRMQGRC